MSRVRKKESRQVKSSQSNGKSQLNGNDSMSDQLTELFEKTFGSDQEAIIAESGHSIHGSRSIEKRKTHNRASSWYKDNAEEHSSAASPAPVRKFQQPHHQPVKESHQMTTEAAVSTEAEAIGKRANSKNEAAELALMQGRQEGIEQGRQEALREVAKKEAKGLFGALGQWAANVYENHRGKIMMATGAALALGTQAAIVAYKQSQGQRTLALPGDNTLVMGPDGVFSPQGQGMGDGRQQGGQPGNQNAVGNDGGGARGGGRGR